MARGRLPTAKRIAEALLLGAHATGETDILLAYGRQVLDGRRLIRGRFFAAAALQALLPGADGAAIERLCGVTPTAGVRWARRQSWWDNRVVEGMVRDLELAVWPGYRVTAFGLFLDKRV